MFMKKVLLVILCVFTVMTVVIEKRNDFLQKQMKKGTILLSNAEALANDEGDADGGDRVYSKNSNTNQYGPYLITLRGQNVFAYRVVTETSCFGLGVINCTSGITESWVPVD
jgi:hypothetical protein